MSFDPSLPVDVYACFGHERGTKYPHWMLMLRSRNSQFGTWYHSEGGPTRNTPYKVAIAGHKRFDSHGIHSKQFLGTIAPTDTNKVKSAAQRVPAQQCQMYVVALVAELERRRLLESGQAARLYQGVQMSNRAREYERQHPITQLASWAEVGITQPVELQTVQPQRQHRGHATPHHPSHAPVQYQSPPQMQYQRQSAEQRPKKESGCCIVM